MHAVFSEFGPLAVPFFRHRQERGAGPNDGHRDHLVSRAERYAPDAASRSPHGTHVGLRETDSHSRAGAYENLALPVGQLGADHRVVRFHPHGDDAAGPHVPKSAQIHTLDDTPPRSHDDEVPTGIGRELPEGFQRGDLLLRIERHEIGDGLAAPCGTDVGNPVDLEGVDAAAVGEDENVGMRRRDEQVRQEVLFPRPHAEPALASPALIPILRDRRPLDVTGVAGGDDDILIDDQILDAEVPVLALDNLGAPLVPVFLAHLP